MLDQLLEYHQTPEPDDFVAEVMRGIKRQQRTRKLILAGSGLVGAAFGVAGMLLLSDTISGLFSAVGGVPISVATMLTLGLLGWLLHEEVGLTA